jgi:hypothetical protein
MKGVGGSQCETSLGKKARPYLKNTKSKRAWGMALMVEHLSSNPRVKKKKKGM